VAFCRYLHVTAALLVFLLAAWNPRASAEEAGKMARVGVLSSAETHPIQSFRERLAELGWIEGKNLRFDYRWAEADDTRWPALVGELVGIPVDLIVTWGTAAALAAKRATTTIPIVMGSVGDPVAAGIVSSLARPGGNITGFSSQSLELEAKRLEVMQDLLPGITRIVMLGNTPNRYIDLAMEKVQRVAAAAGLNFDPVKIDSLNGLGTGLDVVRRAHPDAVLVAAATALFPIPQDHCRVHGRQPTAGDLWLSGVPRGRRPDQLFDRFRRSVPPGSGLCRQNPQRRFTWRAPGTAGHPVQDADQSERGKGLRPDDLRDHSRTCGGDRMMSPAGVDPAKIVRIRYRE
jgi:ABC-type uncharacterized transport system substrate-binding protein